MYKMHFTCLAATKLKIDILRCIFEALALLSPIKELKKMNMAIKYVLLIKGI